GTPATDKWRQRERRGPKLRRLGRHVDRRDGREPVRRDRVIPAMRVAAAALAFFLDVGHFAARRHFAVPADDAAAGECGEAEKPDETHLRVPPGRKLSNIYTAECE